MINYTPSLITSDNDDFELDDCVDIEIQSHWNKWLLHVCNKSRFIEYDYHKGKTNSKRKNLCVSV